METTETKTLGNTIAKSTPIETDENSENKTIALVGKDAEVMAKENNQTKKNAMNTTNKKTRKNNNLTNKTPTKLASSNNTSNNMLNEDNQDNQENASENASENTTENNMKETTNTTKNKSIMGKMNSVAMNLFNHQVVMKLFHFQTELYGAHKASDMYLEKFAGTMDKFLEIAQGIYGRITIKKYTLSGSSHRDNNIINHIEGIIKFLRTGIDELLADYTDLINVRDEIVGDAEQLKYLLTFK